VRSTKTRGVHAESHSSWCSLCARHPSPISAESFEGANSWIASQIDNTV
jgi:uracil DNA glycosylase